MKPHSHMTIPLPPPSSTTYLPHTSSQHHSYFHNRTHPLTPTFPTTLTHPPSYSHILSYPPTLIHHSHTTPLPHHTPPTPHSSHTYSPLPHPHKYQVCVPQEEEGWQGPESLIDVGVVTPGFRDGGAQFGVAESPWGGGGCECQGIQTDSALFKSSRLQEANSLTQPNLKKTNVN